MKITSTFLYVIGIGAAVGDFVIRRIFEVTQMRYKIWSAHFYRAESLLKKYGEVLASFSPQIVEATEDEFEQVTIELNSLEDLHALIKAVDNDIVVHSNNEITIYDDWLE